MSRKELSIFVDESGDFGDYQKYCPYYIVTFLFHDQGINIQENINSLKTLISYLDVPNNYIHAGPIIRQEGSYYGMGIDKRRKTIDSAANFIRTTPIMYHSFIIDRTKEKDATTMTNCLIRQIMDFIISKLDFFEKYDFIKVYYDNGQRQLSNILSSAIPNILTSKAIYKKIETLNEYTLFQIADVICTFELINEKINASTFSKSEEIFFKTPSQFRKNFYRKLLKRKI